ncbi:UNVERIFIED_ORG: hypothetical protein B2H93_04620 [Clostridium botulinum]
MKINVSSDKIVTDRHKERIEFLFNKDNFKLKNISNKWFIDMSDSNNDRVYIIDKNTNQEYSICFFDKKYGYEYIVFKREPLPNDIYTKIIKQRPELKNMNRNDLAGVIEIDKGNVEIFVPRKKNLFEEIIEQQKITDKMFNSGIFILNVSSMDDIDNNSIQIINETNTCIILKMMTKDDINETTDHYNNLKMKFPNIETYTLKSNSSKAIVNDAYDYLEHRGYNVQTGYKPLKL